MWRCLYNWVTKQTFVLVVYGETTKDSAHVLESDCWGMKSWLYYSITLGKSLLKD